MQPKAVLRRTGPTTAKVEYVTLPIQVETPPLDLSQLPPDLMAGIQIEVPFGWIKGQLLNVRNNGAEYVVTLFPEEFDPRYPERALKFTNTPQCQDFVSKWYAREAHDPRAI